MHALAGYCGSSGGGSGGYVYMVVVHVHSTYCTVP